MLSKTYVFITYASSDLRIYILTLYFRDRMPSWKAQLERARRFVYCVPLWPGEVK